MSFGALQFESSDQLPASDGVTVNETQSDVRVAITTTSANSREKPSDDAGQERDRQKDHDVDQRDDDRRRADLLRPMIAASCGGSPFS